VHERPAPWVGDGGRVVVDRAGVERAERAVVEDHIADRQQEGQPVLVEREDGDHEEEVEVRLDLAAPEVDEEGGRRHEAEGR
jgi:hypothetical protein